MTVHSTKSYYQNSFITKSTITLNYSLSTVNHQIANETITLNECKSLLYERFLSLRKIRQHVSLQDCIDELSKEVPKEVLDKVDLL